MIARGEFLLSLNKRAITSDNFPYRSLCKRLKSCVRTGGRILRRLLLLPVALPVVVENQLSESDYVFRSLTTPILAPQFQPAADQ